MTSALYGIGWRAFLSPATPLGEEGAHRDNKDNLGGAMWRGRRLKISLPLSLSATPASPAAPTKIWWIKTPVGQ